ENAVEEQSNVVAAHDKNNSRRINPHKYLLYKPTFSQLMVYIATAFKEINENSALLLYLSADGIKRPVSEKDSIIGYNGGIVTSSRKTFDKTDVVDTNSLVNCLHPNDLVPFTRKPLFLIVDSPNSTAFSSFPRVFDQPFCCLMSPTEYPPSITDTSQIGSLLTLFLHAPLLAFAFISGIHELAKESWERCLVLMTEMEAEVVELFNKSDLEKSVKRFLQDDFLRQFLVRFVLCQSLLRAHTAFQNEKHYPTSSPSLPSGLSVTTELFVKIQQLVKEAH
ncbi:3272_t:CDS:2, partial [Paraglomus occultum]